MVVSSSTKERTAGIVTKSGSRYTPIGSTAGSDTSSYELATPAALTDEELAAELRAARESVKQLYAELRARGYTISSVDTGRVYGAFATDVKITKTITETKSI